MVAQYISQTTLAPPVNTGKENAIRRHAWLCARQIFSKGVPDKQWLLQVISTHMKQLLQELEPKDRQKIPSKSTS